MKPKRSTGLLQGLRDLATGPCIFIVLGAAYLLLGILSVSDPVIRTINPGLSLSWITAGVFLVGLASYYAGIRTAGAALRMNFAPVVIAVLVGTVAMYHILTVNVFAALSMNLMALLISMVLLFSRMRYEYLFASGAILFWINFMISGLPILDGGLHNELFIIVNPLFVLGFLFMLYPLVRMFPARRYLWLFLILSTIVSSYRIYVGIAFITWLLLEVKRRERKPSRDAWKLAGIFSIGVIVGVLFIFMGHSMMLWKYSSWMTDPLTTLNYRFAFTMSVFNDIVNLSYPFGYTMGQSITMEATEFTCRMLYGCTDRITSTAFGEAMLDFGIIGVMLVGWFVGAVLTNLHKHDFGLFAIMMASLIAALDVGINIFMLLQYVYLGWMGLVKKWK